MFNILYHAFFIIFSFMALLKAIYYGIYEINTIKNKNGGIAVICFSTLSIIFVNIVSFLN